MTRGCQSVTVSLARDGTATVDGETVTDGSHAAALNEAIQSLPTSGGHLRLAAGFYGIDDPVVVDRPLALSGPGSGNTTDQENMALLVATDDLDGPVVAVTGEHSDGGFMHGTRLSGFGVVGTADPDGDDDCIRFARPEGVRLTKVALDRVFVDSAGRHGVAFETIDHHVTVTDVWSGHHHGDAFALADGERYWLTNCYGYDSDTGIDIREGVTDCTLVAPHCRRNDTAGLAVAGGPTQVLGGRSIQNDGVGVAVDGADHVTVAYVESFNNAGTGITVGADGEWTENTRLVGPRVGNVGGGNEVTVSTANLPSRLRELGVGGAVSKLRQYGVSNVASGYLPGGSIDKSQDAGIHVGDAATDTVVSDPVYSDLSGPELRDAGTRTVVNGLGQNAGAPDETGQWEGEGTVGRWVLDTEADALYVKGPSGWVGPLAPTV